jgi:hypothetical protein
LKQREINSGSAAGQWEQMTALENEQAERKALPIQVDESDAQEIARREWLCGLAAEGMSRDDFMGLRVPELMGCPHIHNGKPVTALRDGILEPAAPAQAPAARLTDRQRRDQIAQKWRTGNSTDAEYREMQEIEARLNPVKSTEAPRRDPIDEALLLSIELGGGR